MATDYPSIVGPIKWSGKPIKNVSKTPVVAGQLRKRDNGFELVICEDTKAPNIKAQDKLRLLFRQLEQKNHAAVYPTPTCIAASDAANRNGLVMKAVQDFDKQIASDRKTGRAELLLGTISN